jgi:hypothetical protein
MKKIDLTEYGPVISDKEIGNKIYQSIKSILNENEQVEIDLGAIKSMATYCSKQIFGNLYVDFGSQKFYDKVYLKNANNDIKTIINIGIQHALNEGSKK